MCIVNPKIYFEKFWTVAMEKKYNTSQINNYIFPNIIGVSKTVVSKIKEQILLQV